MLHDPSARGIVQSLASASLREKFPRSLHCLGREAKDAC